METERKIEVFPEMPMLIRVWERYQERFTLELFTDTMKLIKV